MTGHALERLIGLYLFCGCGAFLLLVLLVAWGTRHERRAQTERRTPRCVVRFDDYLRSAHDCDVQRDVGLRVVTGGNR